MPSEKIDLSILQPFTPVEIENYISFLRKNGEVRTAQAVEAALAEEEQIPQDIRMERPS